MHANELYKKEKLLCRSMAVQNINENSKIQFYFNVVNEN